MFLCLLGLFVKLRLISTGCKWGSFLRGGDEFVCLVLCGDQKINLSAFWGGYTMLENFCENTLCGEGL